MKLNTDAIDKQLLKLNETETSTVSLSFFRIIVASMIILKMIMIIPYFISLFSKVSVANAYDTKTIIFTYFITGSTLIISALWLIGYQNRSLLFLLFITHLIHIRLLPMTAYGGDYAASIVLLFVPFLDTVRKLKLYKYQVVAHEAAPYALAAIKFTFCVIYFFSGVNKLVDIEWLNGNALSTLLKLDAYNATPINDPLAESGILIKILTWVALLVELIIPFSIWTKKFRKLSIFLALGFHLFIMIFMHIYRFEMLMIAIVLLFVNDEEWEKIPVAKDLIREKKL